MENPKENKRKGGILKKVFIGFGILFLLLIIALVAIPYFFKDELIELAKKEINKNLDAEVNFSDVKLSVFKDFPKLSFGMQDFTVDGKGTFEDVQLMSAKSIDLSLDIMSVVNYGDGNPVAIHTVGLTEPNIHVLVLSDGQANYDIAKSSDEAAKEDEATSTETTDFKLDLQEYYIRNANIVYDDRLGGTYVKLKNFTHEGSGDFTADIYDIITSTQIEEFTARSGGVTYLSKADLNADITVNANMNESKYTLKENELSLNALKLDLDGWVQTQGDDVNLDMKFNAPSTNFKHLLSMIPGAYTKDFEGVDANGNFKFNGAAKGTLNEKDLPAFNLDLEVADGSFQYPDLPLGMKDINTQIKVNSTSSNLDLMTIDIPKFHTLLGQNPFDVQLKLRTPMSDPDVDAQMNGKINLDELSQAFPMEGVKNLSGIITSDIAVKTKMSYVDNEEYDKVDMKGHLLVEGMDYKAEDMPDVLIQLADMHFTPQNVKLEAFNAKMGRSDIQANGTLDNILAYFSPTTTMKGQLNVTSNVLDLNEWMSDEESNVPATTPTTSPEGDVQTKDVEVFEAFSFGLDADLKKIVYEDYELNNVVVNGAMTPQELNVNQLSTQIGKSDIDVNGKLTNLFPFVFDNEALGGDIYIKSNYLDANELLGYDDEASSSAEARTTGEEEPATAEEGVVLVPDNMNVMLHTDIKKVIFTNLELNDMKGGLRVANEAVSLEDVSTKILGGKIDLSGMYSTKDKSNPIYELAYNIDKFDFQKSFNTFNTFKQAAPIAEYIKGIFNSDLTLKGSLGKDMMPDLNTLTAQGSLVTIDALIQNFVPVKGIADKLNVKYLNDDIKLKNTINKFNIKDGKVFIEEFPFEHKGIKMKVGGAHGFNQEIDYLMKLEIPRELIGQGKVAGLAESGLGFLNGFANKAGFDLNNINLGDKVFITLNLTGAMKKPNIKVVKVSMSEDNSSTPASTVTDAIKDVAEDKIDEVKDQAEDKANEVIDQVEDKVDEVVDQVKDQVEDKVDDVVEGVKDQVSDQIGDAIGGQTDSIKSQVDDKLDDILDGKGDDIKDKVEDGIKNWNPFGKKKKKKDE